MGQGIARQGLTESVANLITLSTVIAKLGYRIVRQGIAKGVADFNFSDHEVMAKMRQGIARQGLAGSVANLFTLHP